MANLSNINNKFLVTTGGHVIIGSTSDYVPAGLQVSHGSGNGGILLENTGTTSDMLLNIHTLGLIWQRWLNGTYQANLMTLDYNGNLLIGATSTYPQGDNTILKLYSPSVPRFYLQNTTTGSNITDGSQIYVSGSDLYITNSESANTIFSTNSLQRMRIDSSGIVKINTTAVNARFRVDEGRTSEWVAGFKHTGTTPYGVFIDTSVNTSTGYTFGCYTNTGTGLFVKNDGKVGIGVASGIDANLRVDANSATLTQEILKVKGGGSGGAYGFLVEANNGDDLFKVNTLSYNSYFPNGSVGIGTDSPAGKLEVKGGVGVATTGGTLIVRQDGDTGGDGIALTSSFATSHRIWKNAAGDLNIGNSGNLSALVQLMNGNLGIGTTSPDTDLHVAGNATVGTFRVSPADGTYENYRFDLVTAASTEALSMQVNGYKFLKTTGYTNLESLVLGTKDNEDTLTLNGGDVFINKIANDPNVNGYQFNASGTMTGTVNFTGTNEIAVFNQRDGQGTTQIDFRNGNSARGYIQWTTSGTTYNTVSDYRLKEDLQDFNGLDKISKIPVYDFKWKENGKRSYGVIAHELQEILPQAVSGEKDAEKHQVVDYSKIVPLLVKSIQELKAEIELLKSK